MKKNLLILIILTISYCTEAQITLPKLVSNGMVLQQKQKLNLWGWASANEAITISFFNHDYQTQANKKGEWNIQLPPLKAGGPYQMKLEGKNSITLDNIYIGEVWLCSGQSNMELPMRRVAPLYKNEMDTVNNTTIRIFRVPQTFDFHQPKTQLKSGEWLPATKENISEFSAVAYFFAKHLQKTEHVPIGLINASLGGSPVESWICEDSIKQYPDAYNDLLECKDDTWVKSIQDKEHARDSQWYQQLSLNDRGLQNNWKSSTLDDNNWLSIQVPDFWENSVLESVNGVIWFRKKVTINQSMTNIEAMLELGAIIDADSVFVNGQFIGNTTYRYPPRWYKVPANLLQEGENTIAIKVISQSGSGGFVPDKPYRLCTNKDTIHLDGSWKYKIGTTASPLPGQTFFRWRPTGLYNGMIHPIIHYTIKGAIWYQGESNVNNASEYEKRLSSMIRNWRADWNQGDFPFLIVQVANYLSPDSIPSESNWATLRDAQYQVARKIKNANLAATIDIGEWNDIHPLNKETVGIRLALAAQKTAYQRDDIIASGPEFKDFKIKKNTLVVSYTQVGSGLVTNDGKTPQGFAIAGSDSSFVWAEARIKGSKVIVWHPSIQHPTAVRYGWADNPDTVNLYNKEGLPAIPFRTDK